MTDRIDEEGRASFVQTLPRKVTELRATLGTLVADPKSQRMRDELRRRLHALYTLTRSYELSTLSEGLREGIAHLDAIRGANVLSQRDLETLADLIATLPALAQRDLPDQPSLFQSRAKMAIAAAEASASGAAPPGPVIKRASLPPLPGLKLQPAAEPASTAENKSSEAPSVPAPTPTRTTAPQAAAAPPAATSVAATTSASSAPLGVLVVSGEGVALQVRRALPPEADITVVRTLSEAITAARDTSPDVIVAEATAPADGLGLLAALRGDPLTDFLPVVLLATLSDGIDTSTARAQGAAELVTLPVESERLRASIERAAQGVSSSFSTPPSFGEVTLEELTQALQEEIRRGILGAAGPRAGNARISLGQGSEVLAATWEAIARVRDVVEKRTRGKVRFELPGSPLGFGGAHVLSIGAEEEGAPDDDGSMDDPLPGRKALVVDDDPGVVWFFAGLLREAGMDVTECTEGAQALRDARRVRPDVIISDILMPGMDGFALSRAIRRDVSLRNIPVILLSWKEDLLVRMRELGANAQGFLRKESKGEAILARVRAVARPRIRLLRRLEELQEGAELRGRVERVGVYALVEVAARALRNVTLTVTDSFSVTEIELRDGKLVAIVRTLQDGSLVRGESALLQVLGANNARFAIKRTTHAIRPNVQGELKDLLNGGAALISAVEDSLSGAALLEVASIDLDSEAAVAYGKSLPEGMRGIVERIVVGESPRNLVLKDGIAPQELEPILVELARRGAIRSVRGRDGEDLVAPRYAAAMSPAGEIAPKKDSGTLPAVLRSPESLSGTSASATSVVKETERTDYAREIALDTSAGGAAGTTEKAATEASTPTASAEMPTLSDAKKPSWKPPQSIDEAAKPGFGIEAAKESLETAVLKELSEQPAPEPTAAADEESDEPEMEEGEGEASLSDEELEQVASKGALPSGSGVKLDSRGLPRRRQSVSVDDLPAIEGDAFTPHEPVKKDERPSDSIIVDIKAIGAPVEVREAPPSKKKAAGASVEDRSGAAETVGSRGWMWLIAAMVVLGLASYLVVRFAFTNAPSPAVSDADASAMHNESDASATNVVPIPATDAGAVQASVDGGTVAPALNIGDAGAPAAPSNANVPEAALVYEDPAPFLDGGVLPNGRGLLVIEGPTDPQGEITVNQRAVGVAPTSLALPPGVHTIRYRTHAVVVFRFVPVQAGRAVRITLPREP